MGRATGAVRRPDEPLRHNAFTAYLARGPVGARTVLLEMLIEHDARMRALEQLGEQILALLNWLPAQIMAVASKSNAQSTALPIVPWRRINSNTASPFSSQTIRQDQTGSLPMAIAMKGNRPEKSFPARVISRTPALSRRAKIRNPSCFISCGHPGPEGGSLAGEDRSGCYAVGHKRTFAYVDRLPSVVEDDAYGVP